MTWDTDNPVILRNDGGGHSPFRCEGTGAGDVGYPVSIQLPDGEVLPLTASLPPTTSPTPR